MCTGIVDIFLTWPPLNTIVPYPTQVAGNETLWGDYRSQPCSSGGGSNGRLAEWVSWLNLETPPPPTPPPPPIIEAGRLWTAESKTSSSSSSSSNGGDGGSSDSNSSGSSNNRSSDSARNDLRDWLVRTLRKASQERHHRDLDSCCGGCPLVGEPS